MPLVAWIGGGDATQGYFKTVAIYALIAVALLYACFASTRERVLAKPSPAKPWADFKLLLGSRAWNILALHSMVMYLSLLMPIGAAMYFLIYVVKAPALAPLYFLLGNVGNLVGVLVSDRLTRRFCKLQVLRTCAWIAALALLGFLWIDTGSLWQVFGLAFLVAALCFVGAPITMSMSADVADSIELSSGRRIVGLASSALSLAVKVGMGLGSAVTGAVLSYTGYQAGVDQSPQAVHGILMCMGLGPAVAMALVALVLQAYPLNRTRLSQMQADLALRRAAA
jgi:GPH family glycoside/pentoside/hexuronide:cation symporter